MSIENPTNEGEQRKQDLDLGERHIRDMEFEKYSDLYRLIGDIKEAKDLETVRTKAEDLKWRLRKYLDIVIDQHAIEMEKYGGQTRTPEQTFRGLSAEVREKLEQLVSEHFDSHPDAKVATSVEIDEIVNRVITEEKLSTDSGKELSIAVSYFVGVKSASRRPDLSK